MIQNGQAPSEFILRPEVSKIILGYEVTLLICPDSVILIGSTANTPLVGINKTIKMNMIK